MSLCLSAGTQAKVGLSVLPTKCLTSILEDVGDFGFFLWH